jgi:hypothetical protein
MAKRVPWRRVKAKALTMHNQTLYERYAHAFEVANDLGRQLKEVASSEWNNKYPSGIDGQICIFRAIDGALMYVMKDKEKLKESAEDVFNPDHGDDVFCHPSAWPACESDKANIDIDERDTLAIIGERLQHVLNERAETEEQKSAASQKAVEISFSERLREAS